MKSWGVAGVLLLLLALPACTSDPAAGDQISFVGEGDGKITDPNNLITGVDAGTDKGPDATSVEVIEDIPPVPDHVEPDGEVTTPDTGPEIIDDALTEVVEPDSTDVPNGGDDAEIIEDIEDIDEADQVSEDVTEDAGPDDATEPVACQEDSDCPVEEDALDCVTAACLDGLCVSLNAKTGTACSEVPDDLHPECVVGACDAAGGCVSVLLDDTPCDDADPCTHSETCDGQGQCGGGLPVVCPATSSCELSLCDTGLGGCTSFAAFPGLPCEDGDPCTVGSSCQGTECAGGENLCSCLVDQDCPDDGDLCNGVAACLDLPGGGKGCGIPDDTLVDCGVSDNPCITLLCEAETGACYQEVLAGTPCDDSDLCSKDDVCNDTGECVGAPVVCNDEDSCTTDICDSGTGVCVFELATGAPCTDGDPCTTGDICTEGLCAGETKNCDDGNECTESECDAESGACVFTVLVGKDCDDSNTCTEGDLCNGESGLCEGDSIDCHDGNPCTSDSCLPALGCVFTANTIACDDGDACTGPDQCKNGGCKTTDLVCDDAIDCTSDSCDSATGCIYETQNAACDDENPCTEDFCDPLSGCRNEPVEISCDDGNACTGEDICSGGVCLGQNLDCNDDIACTIDSCDQESGCSHQTQDEACEDGNPCTEASCSSDSGCVLTSLDGTNCDDDNPCTQGDVCGESLCQPGENTCVCTVDADCDDDNLCNGVFACEAKADGTTECVQTEEPVECVSDGTTPCLKPACNPETGQCASLPMPNDTLCPDNDPCTHSETCQGGACVVQPVDCEDGLSCTVDSCNSDGGCEHAALDLQCSDGVPCTVDVCHPVNGCTSTPSIESCDDGVPCTKDICDAGEGCVYVGNDTQCDDGVICTTESCDLTDGCVYNFDHDSCNDDDTCTDDVCVAGQGCVHELNAAPCSDGNPCTDGDVCTEGVCVSGIQVLCDDANPCTTGGCDPTSGICNYNVLEDGTSCEDGDVCTNPDACQGGQCLIGPLETCEDGIDCTTDFCDPVEGCSNTPDDLSCDDGNPCTADVCLLGEGCLHETLPTLGACDDGLDGTFSDVCIEGVCRGFQTSQVNFSAGILCQVTAAAASRVADLNGNFFAIVNYDAEGLICDGERSRVMALDGADSPSGVGEFALEGTLVGLSYNLSVGDQGEVGTLVNQGSFITYINDVQGALDDEGWDDARWSDVWGEAIYTSFGLILAERYVLVGRQSDDKKVLVQICTRQNNNVLCQKFTAGMGNKQSKYRPVAVDGYLLPCEDCWDVPPEELAADFAFVSNDTDGKRSLLSTQADGKLKRFVVPGQGDLTDVIHLGDTIWVSGEGGFVGRFVSEEWTTFTNSEEAAGDNPVVALTIARGHVFALVGGEEPKLLATPMEGGADAAWQQIPLGDVPGIEVRDVHATDDALHVVGLEPGTDDGPETEALIWYLPF